MHQRFLDVEVNRLLSTATLLEPRFNKIAFADMGAADQFMRHLTHEMAVEIATMTLILKWTDNFK